MVDDFSVLYYSKNHDAVYLSAGIGYEMMTFKIDSTLNICKQTSLSLPNVKTVIDYGTSVLFGTDGNGLIEQKGDHLTWYTPNNSNISSDAVHSLFTDKEGSLWIGTYRGGLNFYTLCFDWFHSLKMNANELSHSVVTAVYPERDKIYIGLDGGGLNIYNRATKEVTIYSYQNSLIAGNNVLAICGDEKYLWLAIYGKGLCRFSRKDHTFKNYDLATLNGNRESNKIWDIREDKKGNIWIIGMDVYVFNTKNESFLRIAGIHDASSLVFDGDFIWIGTNHSGLYQIDKNGKISAHYHKTSKPQALESDAIRYMYMDSKKNLWLTTESTLCKLKKENGKITAYTEQYELFDNKVVSIQEDSLGFLWMGTYKGLCRYDNNDNSVIHFGKIDNLDAGQFNYHACAQDSNFFYMGSTKGMFWFNPTEIQYSHQGHPVYLTSLELLGEKQKKFHLYGNENQEVTLSHTENFFTIHFSAPEMLAPARVSFSCYMKGFEQNWHKIGNKHQVSYTNVPPGKYTFYVKSTDREGKWNDQSTCLHILITPPWWRTYWAWSLWIILMGRSEEHTSELQSRI